MYKVVLYSLILIIVGVFSFSAGEVTTRDNMDIVGERVNFVQEEYNASTETYLPDVIESVLPTVVGVSAVSRRGEGYSESLGSGVILSDMGYIVTNHHVVGDNPYSINVTLFDGNVKKGKLTWSDKALDIAVLKINDSLPSVAKMGNSEDLRVGEDVFAIGNPLSFQFERSVTKGIVSALNRTITLNTEDGVMYMEDLIQTDASINPGNSGGPLMNTKGEVIGINTIRVQSAEGMGFAVPINIFEGVIESLETTGKFETPYLGLYAYTSQTAKYLKKEKNDNGEGLFVMSLDMNGPAYKSGIRYGDLIIEINGKYVDSMLKLRQELFKHKVGENVTLTVIKENIKKEIEIECGEMTASHEGANQ
ncbi:MAG: S1C family serine protease [Clostridia bacterium]